MKRQGTDRRPTKKGRPIPERDYELKSKAMRRKERWTGFIIVLFVLVLILAIVVPVYYQNLVAPFHRTIITVDDTQIDMGYFLKRTKLAGTDPMDMLTSLTNEQLIKLGTPRYGIEVSPDDIEQALRKAAQGGSENSSISDAEFKEWYRQQLNQTGLSDSEFKELMRTSLLASRLQEYLAAKVPTVAEQVHLYGIVTNTYEDAQKARARWQAGEDFSAIAENVSVDQSKEKKGEFGWVPRGILPSSFEEIVFNLSTGNVSDPVPYTQSYTDSSGNQQTATTYYLFKVPEKAGAREIDNDSLQILKAGVINVWLGEEIKLHQINYNFNSEISAWINWQLAKTTPGSGQQQ